MTMRLAPVIAALCIVACAHSKAAEPAVAAPNLERTTLTYLGVAGWQLNVGEHTLLFDPFFSRLDIKDDTKPIVPDEAAIARFAPAKADAILIGHSHYDHLLDVPSIALKTKASIVGTESTAHVAIAAGVPRERVFVVKSKSDTEKANDEFTFGPFNIRAVRALHSLTGQTNLPIPENVTMPMAARDYNEGGTLQYLVRAAGHDIYFIGTANFLEEKLIAAGPIHAGVAIIATGLREKIPGYTCRLMELLGHPRLVLTNHFDAFKKPLVPGQMTLSEDSKQDLDAFAAEVKSCSPQTRVVVPVHLQPVDL